MALADAASPMSTREWSRARAIRRFRWSILGPLIALFTLVLLPVLFLQLYFSFHQWTVYLGSWWEADFVGLDLFKEVFTDERFGWAIIRSLAFATASTVGCFLLGFGLAYLMYKPFPGQPFFYVIFILPMLTVPIVVAYTAEMMLYQSGPINDIISRISGTQFKVAWLSDAKHRARRRDAARNLELDPVLLHHHARRSVVHPQGADRGGADPGRVTLARILGGAASAAAAGDLPCAGVALPRGDGGVPENWALFQGGPGTATETIPVYIFLTTWQYFQISKGAALSYVAMMLMIVIVLARDPAAAAREAGDRRDV